jgi:hypothetical protein
MKRNRVASVLFLSIVVLLLAQVTWAQSGSEEQQIQAMQTDVDASKAGQKAHTEMLGKQFQLAPSEIEQLRNAGQGWGEVTIRLAMADKLLKADPAKYPTMQAALDQIGTLRSEGKGWGQIAKELGFKLGPVVSEVRHALNDLRRDSRAEHLKASGTEKRESRLDVTERGQRPERPERLSRPERPERPEKPERNNR